MVERLHSRLMLALLLANGCAANQLINYRDTRLVHDGAYVADIDHGRCDGCDSIARGDVIQAIDGVEVSASLEALEDGDPHTVEFWDQTVGASVTATITISPEASSPIVSVDVETIRGTPVWARRRMFARAVPELALIGMDREPITGLDLLGRAQLVVLFDWASASDRQNAALCMQVLQKAQADLADRGVDIVFAQVPHPQQAKFAPMSIRELSRFFYVNQVDVEEGGPLPPPPLYRSAHRADRVEPRGIEHVDFREQLGEAPNILIIDERGVIVWHSAGPVPDPTGSISVDMVYTINDAVWSALGMTSR